MDIILPIMKPPLYEESTMTASEGGNFKGPQKPYV